MERRDNLVISADRRYAVLVVLDAGTTFRTVDSDFGDIEIHDTADSAYARAIALVADYEEA